MKLRNKKTGEIITAVFADVDFMSANDIANCPYDEVRYYHSLAELNAEWEDYEPKESHFSDEFIEDIMVNVFDFCPCGAPHIFVNQLYEYLKLVEARALPDDKYIPYEYLADKARLTEHGSSVLGAWLSDDGKRLLKRMEENK